MPDYIMDAPSGAAVDTTLDVPLCVDLDGTLIRTDMLAEGLAALLSRPLEALKAVAHARRGRAGLKQAVAEAGAIDPSSIPYTTGFLAFLREEKARGRRLILVTAADATVAERIADHLQLFDRWIASDGRRNLKGAVKAAELVRQFGEGGFDYAGDSAADVAVWLVARRAILVNASATVARRVAAVRTVERVFSDRPPAWRSLLRAMRPHQWVKNMLLFGPVFVSGAAIGVADLVKLSAAFLAFSAAASAIYIVNDLTDLAADRAHPRKRRRPFAAGDASILSGLLVSAGCFVTALLVSHSVGILPTVCLYMAMSWGYSVTLKELPLVDVFVLAALYSIRLFAGGEIVGHLVSHWLLMFSSFVFLGLALLKRAAELAPDRSTSHRTIARRGYAPADLPIIQMFGCSCAVAAAVVLAMFVQSERASNLYASPDALWGVVPLVLFWQFRMWLSTVRGYMHDDPILYAARDWVSGLTALAVVILVIAARTVPGG